MLHARRGCLGPASLHGAAAWAQCRQPCSSHSSLRPPSCPLIWLHIQLISGRWPLPQGPTQWSPLTRESSDISGARGHPPSCPPLPAAPAPLPPSPWPPAPCWAAWPRLASRVLPSLGDKVSDPVASACPEHRLQPHPASLPSGVHTEAGPSAPVTTESRPPPSPPGFRSHSLLRSLPIPDCAHKAGPQAAPHVPLLPSAAPQEPRQPGHVAHPPPTPHPSC